MSIHFFTFFFARALNFDASNARGTQGRVLLDKHQIQASALDLSYST